MGMAGAPFPYYIGYLQPSSAFGLAYAVNSIAMPLIGGTTSWVGPLIGAILLGSLQQIATVTISSAVNLLIVGLAARGLRDRRTEWHRRAGAQIHAASAGRRGRPPPRRGRRPGTRAMTAPQPNCSRSTISASASAASSRSTTSRFAVKRGRARRPHRAQRLGQEHAGQLHLRHAAERDRLGRVRRPPARRRQRASAHPPRTGAHLSAAAAVRQSRASPTICAFRSSMPWQRAAPAAPAATIEARCVELLREVGLDAKAKQSAARSHPGRDAQARTRARHGGGAEAL